MNPRHGVGSDIGVSRAVSRAWEALRPWGAGFPEVSPRCGVGSDFGVSRAVAHMGCTAPDGERAKRRRCHALSACSRKEGSCKKNFRPHAHILIHFCINVNASNTSGHMSCSLITYMDMRSLVV